MKPFHIHILSSFNQFFFALFIPQEAIMWFPRNQVQKKGFLGIARVLFLAAQVNVHNL